MKLLGSTTSPYVRRTRLLLGDADYEFVNLDIYGENRDLLRRHNPALKIPMLIDGDQEIYDSRVIARYLSEQQKRPPLSWDQENQLTLIDAANDSAVVLLLSERSGIDTKSGAMFYELQRERIMTTLKSLSAMLDAGEFDQWSYPSICLYSLIDWIDFRNLLDFEGVDSLISWRDRMQDQPYVMATDPRQA